MREQPGRARKNRNGLHDVGREAQVEHHRSDRERDVHRERFPPDLRNRLAQRAREQNVRPADVARVCEHENPLGAGVERPVNRVAEPRHLAAEGVDRTRDVAGNGRRPAAGRHFLLRLLEQPRASLGRPEDDRPGTEDPCRDRPLQRLGVGGERHARGDVARHQPVLGDRHEQQVEEEALVVGRLAPGEEQVEVVGEAQPAHQVAAEVAAAHFDPVGVGLADVADGLVPVTVFSRHRNRIRSRGP